MIMLNTTVVIWLYSVCDYAGGRTYNRNGTMIVSCNDVIMVLLQANVIVIVCTDL